MGEDESSTLFELLPIGAYRSSVDGRPLRANGALVRLNGYASEAEMLAAVNDIGNEWYVDAQRRVEFLRLMQRDGQVVVDSLKPDGATPEVVWLVMGDTLARSVLEYAPAEESEADDAAETTAATTTTEKGR